MKETRDSDTGIQHFTIREPQITERKRERERDGVLFHSLVFDFLRLAGHKCQAIHYYYH